MAVDYGSYLIKSEKLVVKVLALGATLAEVHAFDRNGDAGDVVLGYEELDGWSNPKNPCMNCIIGRTAGRNAAPGIMVNGILYHLPGTDGGGNGIKDSTNLHGGMIWNFALWRMVEHTECLVVLEHICPEGPFPGSVSVKIRYEVSDDKLWMVYDATTTALTPISLTNHTYWNLSAGVERDVRGHELQLQCDSFSLCSDSGDGLPTGVLSFVKGTARDLQSATSVGEVMDAQVRASPHWPHGEEFVVTANRGADPNAVAAVAKPEVPPLAAVLAHPSSGRVMRVYTSEPVVQTYYSTLLGDCGARMKGGLATYEQGAGICLEAQRHANAEACGAPSRLVAPGETYRQVTVHEFGIE